MHLAPAVHFRATPAKTEVCRTRPGASGVDTYSPASPSLGMSGPDPVLCLKPKSGRHLPNDWCVRCRLSRRTCIVAIAVLLLRCHDTKSWAPRLWQQAPSLFQQQNHGKRCRSYRLNAACLRPNEKSDHGRHPFPHRLYDAARSPRRG